MDEIGKRFVREIAAAIARAAAADRNVEAWREMAHAAGFDLNLPLEAAIASAIELKPRPAAAADTAPPPTVVPAFDLTPRDIRLLKSLRIGVDTVTEPA